MNTMEITKFVGAICGSLLIFLLIQTAAHAIYNTESETVAFVIEGVETGGAGGEEAVEDVDVAGLVAAADVAKGETIFKKCAACHKLDGANAVGPHLNGIVGRPGGLGRRLHLLRPHEGPRRRLDSGQSLPLPRQPQEVRARHQDVLRWPARSRKNAPTSSPTSSSTRTRAITAA